MEEKKEIQYAMLDMVTEVLQAVARKGRDVRLTFDMDRGIILFHTWNGIQRYVTNKGFNNIITSAFYFDLAVMTLEDAVCFALNIKAVLDERITPGKESAIRMKLDGKTPAYAMDKKIDRTAFNRLGFEFKKRIAGCFEAGTGCVTLYTPNRSFSFTDETF